MAVIKNRLYANLVFMLVACSPAFDRKKADVPVSLNTKELALYEELNKQVLSDLPMIRAVSKEHSFHDTTFLSTNSYYLYKLHSIRYAPLIRDLVKRKIFLDDIMVSRDSIACYRIKDVLNEDTLPHYTYSHIIVYNAPLEFELPWDIEEVLKDSTINQHWRYIYFKAQVGH